MNASNFYGRAVYDSNTVRARRTMGGKYEQHVAVMQYAGCYSSIVAAFIANRLSADSLVEHGQCL